MAATRTPNRGTAPGREELDAWFREREMEPTWWGNGPGDKYGRHAHTYHKVLFCAEGAITFHTRQGDVELGPGDRLDIEPGTEHAASVGPAGVTCVEAPRRP